MANSKLLNRQLPPSDGSLTLDKWLAQVPESITALQDDSGDNILEGIWCGAEGRYRAYIPAIRKSIVVQWYRGKVDCAYIA